MGYIYVWECSRGGRHIDADWSSNFEDLYSLELDFRIFVWPMCFLFNFIGFSDAPTPLTVHLRSSMSDQSCEIRQPLGELSP